MSDTSMVSWSLADAAQKLDASQISSVELTRHALDLIKARDGELGCFLLVDEKGALAAAHASDARRRAGGALGPLDGVPLAIKDLIVTEGLVTTAGSRILEGYVPPYDATVVKKLKAAGAVLLGKLNQDEFGMGSSNENSAYKPCRNPWDLTRTPGGSSGGSAAAVAAGLCFGALGTDTGGSIRQPASFCGITGLKPTYGRVSRFGMVAYASSLDQIGPMARDVESTAMMLGALAGFDERDATSVNAPVPNYLQGLDGDVRGLKIGIAKEYFGEGIDQDVRDGVDRAMSALKGRGAELIEVSLPLTPYAIATYYIIATAEASSNLSRYDGVRFGPRRGEGEGLVAMYEKTRGELFGPEVKRRIMLGTYVLSAGYYDAYYLRAQKVRRLFSEDFNRAFEQVDVIICPTTPTPAFRLGEKVSDPLQMYLNDIFTVSANLAGLPAMSLNCGFSKEKLPIGVQLIGKPFDEQVILRTGYAIEEDVP